MLSSVQTFSSQLWLRYDGKTRKKNHNNRIEMRNGIINGRRRRRKKVHTQNRHQNRFFSVVFQSNWIRVVFINSHLFVPRAHSLTILVASVPTNRSSSIYTQHFFIRLNFVRCLLFWFDFMIIAIVSLFKTEKKLLILQPKNIVDTERRVAFCTLKNERSCICWNAWVWQVCGERGKKAHLMPLIITLNE